MVGEEASKPREHRWKLEIKMKQTIKTNGNENADDRDPSDEAV